MLRPEAELSIPEETVRVAKAAFPKGNEYMQIRDELGTIYQDEAFKNIFSRTGQPGYAPWRLALITVMQFAERLTDRQAADAVRGRIDWKYALGLALSDAGFDHTVLSEFRQRLVAGSGESYLLDALLKLCRERQWLKAGGRARTDSTHILANIHTLHRLELVGQTLQHALNEVAGLAPDWLQARVPTVWYERYEHKLEDYRLPKKDAERQRLAEQIGQDGQTLISWVDGSDSPSGVGSCPAITVLRQVWTQQYEQDPTSGVKWRSKEQLPPAAERVASPHDPQARYSVKNETEWVGYKVHLTEGCDDDLPHLITHVETTPATQQDIDALDAIHEALDKRDVLPKDHLVDTAYPSAEQLVHCQQDYDLHLVGPVRPDVSWQANTPQAFDISQFQIDWQQQRVTCPNGNLNRSWSNQIGPRGKPVIEVQFAAADCSPCPVRGLCTRAKTAPRTLTLQPPDLFVALQSARQRQTTQDFKDLYAKRAGIEGTLSQAVYALKMRRSRYIGLAKTHLQHIATAVAINFQRLVAWLNGDLLAPTRTSPFAALAGKT